MPSGISSFPALNSYTVGSRVNDPAPLDAYLGPWEASAGTTSAGVSLANSILVPTIRYQGQKVIIIANSNPGSGQTLAYVYWYRGGTADGNLEEFSSGGGGIVGDYVTTFNGRTGAVQGVSAALPGDGIAVSAATGSVTITNIGVTYISAGSFISVSGNTGTVTISNIGVHSFNGNTGAVIGASLGANTFTGLNAFDAGVSASTVYVSSGSTFAGSVIFDGGLTASRIDATGNVSVGGTLDVYGNLYIQGTLTTVNETQLLIQDKYLVLGSTFATGTHADGAGIYVGSTTNAIAGLCYNNGGSHWSSSHSFNIPSGSVYKVNGTTVLAGSYLGSAITGSSLTSVGTISIGVWQGTTLGLAYGGTNRNLSGSVAGGVAYSDGSSIDVTAAGTSDQYLKSNGSSAPTWASFSALTGLTADRVKTTATNSSGTYYLTFVTGAANSTDLYVDTSTGITYDPATDTLSCVKIEAIVDGGTW